MEDQRAGGARLWRQWKASTDRMAVSPEGDTHPVAAGRSSAPHCGGGAMAIPVPISAISREGPAAWRTVGGRWEERGGVAEQNGATASNTSRTATLTVSQRRHGRGLVRLMLLIALDARNPISVSRTGPMPRL